MNLLAELTEGTRISSEAIRANLLRSVLTTLGIVIGIVTVTLMATALEALDAAFRDAISFIGTDVLYVDQREWFIDSDTRWDAAAKRGKITLPQVRAVEEAMSMAKGVAPSVMHGIESVRYKNRSSGLVLLIGTNEQFLVTGGVTLSAGRFMTQAEAGGNRDICVVGSDVAEKLFLKVSTAATNDPSFSDNGFAAELAGTGLDPNDLVIEMAERMAALDKNAFRIALRALKAQGFHIAIEE